MGYPGEHLLPGQLGQFFIVLSLVASLVATFAYFKSTQSGIEPDALAWKKLARYAFITETISVFAIFGILFYIIYNHLFEYKYAWQHSSRSLEVKYLLSCFWEGQEGSFLLWSIWHCVLGLILMKTSKKWEAPVMTTLSFGQFCLATMIAGIYIFGQKIGSNPFILLRDSGVLDNAPALHVNFDPTMALKPDYMLSIKDGNDLNPLLQNYWMVIHPPVLFMGFASTIVPFAFAIAGLWKKNFSDWTKPALPWALFSSAVLGVGVMMGAMWAYESLTFGGYWAWDPVENAALVPWMVLIAGIHTLLIYKHSGHSLRATHLFFILSFFLVLYSTFLTRSGILGDSSVHAFTDLGMNIQLYLFMYLFVWLTAILSSKNPNQKISSSVTATGLLLLVYLLNLPWLGLIALLAGIGFIFYHIQSQVPTIHKEENISSREFWMFIGSLVFFLSAIVIIGKTSLPVFNKIFGTKIAPPEDPEYAYNQIQVFVAVIIGLLTAGSQYLKYKHTTPGFFWKKIWLPTIIAVAISTLILAFGNINYNKQGVGFLAAIWIAIASSVYAIVANAAYIWLGVKGSLKLSGGSIAHLGFGMVLLGILVSSSKKEILSYNTSGIAINFGEGSKEKTGENLTLVKGLPTRMGKYMVTYESDSMHPRKQEWYYKIRFRSMDGKESFTLLPDAFVNYKGNQTLMANPDSKHYWDHDVFAYVTALPNPAKNEDTAQFHNHILKKGDTSFYSKGFFVLEKFSSTNHLPNARFDSTDVGTVATIKVYSQNNASYISEPLFIDQKGISFSQPDTVTSEDLIFRINKVDGDKIDIGVKESNNILQYVTLKAYRFPFIRLLWLGIIITALGILISMVRRIRLNRISVS